MKILILQLKRIGDLILTTPAIRCLREALPDARLVLVADSSCAGLLEAIPVDERLVYRKGGGLAGTAGWGPNAWMRRGSQFSAADWCLDFTGTDRAAWLSALSFARRRVTFQRFRKKPLRRWIYTDFVDSSVRDRHTGDHYTDLLRPLGIEREGVAPELALPETALARARALLAEAGVASPYAVIHAGTARAEKYWRPERWAEVAAHLRGRYGLGCVLTGSGDAAEQKHLQAIQAASGAVNLAGRTGLAELAALIRGARLFCGVDTAAMHMADAVGTPCIALFGPTNPFHWRPRFARSVVLRSGTREPFAPGQSGGSMADIPADAVKAAADSLLA